MSILGQVLANIAQPQVQKREKEASSVGARKASAKTADSTASSSASGSTKAAQASDAAANVKADSLVRGEVIDLRPNQVLVRLENGAKLSARLEGSIALYIGQKADFFVSQTTDSLITLKLAPSSAQENPVVDKILQGANLQKNDHTVAIVNELLAHQQPVTGANIRHYLMLSAKYPELPAKDLILMELHQIPVSEETTAQFAAYRADSHRLLTQGTTLLNILSEQIASLPDAAQQTAFVKELQTLFASAAKESGQPALAPPPALMEDSAPANAPDSSTWLSDSSTEKNLLPDNPVMDGSVTIGNPDAAGAAPGKALNLPGSTLSKSGAPLPPDSPAAAYNAAADKQTAENGNPDLFSATQAADKALGLSAPASSVSEAATPLPGDALPLSLLLSDLKREFLNSFLLSPEEIAEEGRISDYYSRLNEQLAGLEQLAERLSKSTGADTAQTPAKQLRSNLSFMDMVNQVFPYVQLPLQFKEHPAHGELYVYEKKRSLSDSGSLSALLHLELEALGTTDIFVTLTALNVAARFYLADETAKYLITEELPSLQEALRLQGYSLQTEVAIREDHPEDDSLLEQFMEEHSPSELHRYTFDIRA